MPECDEEIGASQSEQLPANVHVVAVLAGERPRRRHALDVGEQQAGRRERLDAVDVARPDSRQPDGGQPGGYRPHGGDAAVVETEDGGGDDREHHHDERHRPSRQKVISQQ